MATTKKKVFPIGDGPSLDRMCDALKHGVQYEKLGELGFMCEWDTPREQIKRHFVHVKLHAMERAHLGNGAYWYFWGEIIKDFRFHEGPSWLPKDATHVYGFYNTINRKGKLRFGSKSFSRPVSL